MSILLYRNVSMFFQYLFSIRAASGLTDVNETMHTTEKTLVQDLSCCLDFSPVFSITSSCISFFLPSVVMIGIYVKLWSIGRGHVKSIKVKYWKNKNPKISKIRENLVHGNFINHGGTVIYLYLPLNFLGYLTSPIWNFQM